MNGPREPLAWQEVVDALDALAGRRIAVRIVASESPERLVLVTHARLGARHPGVKQPSLFWPLGEQVPGELEQPGLYLSEDEFVGAHRRPGDILVIDHGAGLVNVRPL